MNPFENVRKLLSVAMWQFVAKMMLRSVAYAQNRYCELLQARLECRAPVPGSCKLIGVVREGQSPSDVEVGDLRECGGGSGDSVNMMTSASNNAASAATALIGTARASTNTTSTTNTNRNTATTNSTTTNTTSNSNTSNQNPSQITTTNLSASRPTYKPYVRHPAHVAVDGHLVPKTTRNILTSLMKRVVDTVVARTEKEAVIAAHREYNNNVTRDGSDTLFMTQPRLSPRELLYVHNKQLLTAAHYPWAGIQVVFEEMIRDAAQFAEYQLLLSTYNSAIVKYAAILHKYRQAEWHVKNSGVNTLAHSNAKLELIASRRLFHSNAMPTNYTFMDTQNKSVVSYCRKGAPI